MTNSGNIGNQGQTPSFKGFLPPPLSAFTSPSAIAAKGTTGTGTTGTTGTTATGPIGQGYYADTQSSVQVGGKPAANYLNNIPAPNAQASGTSGSKGGGNPFLDPNPLVAFFIDFNEIANIMRQTTMAQEQTSLIEMSLVNDLASGEASQIITAAQQDALMYTATAVSSFVEAGAAGAQLVGQGMARNSTSNEMSTEQTEVDENVSTAQTNLNNVTELEDADNANTTAQTNLQAKQAAVVDSQTNPVGNSPEEQAANTNQKTQEFTEAQTQADAANDRLVKAKQNFKDNDIDSVDSAQQKLKKAQTAQQQFKANYATNYQHKLSDKTWYHQMVSTMITKGVDAGANAAKAWLTVHKSLAEAQQKMMSAYMQNAFKMIDTLNKAQQENSSMVADLFRQLQKFSDDDRKLGGSIAVQSTG